MIPLYHWAPRERFKSICRKGLVPGSRSTLTVGEWRPPYICFADSPSLAWGLSGALVDHVPLWDLWMVWSNVPAELEKILMDEGGRVREYRVRERVYKRDVWYVGSRSGVKCKNNLRGQEA